MFRAFQTPNSDYFEIALALAMDGLFTARNDLIKIERAKRKETRPASVESHASATTRQ